ncbi:DUF6196 family protein [Micromonospora sp. NPDC049089]
MSHWAGRRRCVEGDCVGWRRLGTGVFVICGHNSERGGIYPSVP